MPRKQNGWGKSDTFGFKPVSTNVKSGKKGGADGYYPSDRSFGSMIVRTPVQKLNIDSKWKKWYKGYEYYAKADAVPIDVPFRMTMFRGTDNEIKITFTGERYPSKRNDSSVRYVLRRLVEPHNHFGTIAGIYNNPRLYPELVAKEEIWTPIGEYNHYVNLFAHERLRNQNQSTVAILKTRLTQDEKPAIYTGQTKESRTRNKFTTSLSGLMATDFIKKNNNDINALVGQLTLFTGVSTFNDASGLTFRDDQYTIDIDMEMQQTIGLLILNSDGMDPGQMFVEQEDRPLIFYDPAATMDVKETFTLLKSEYQPYWGVQYFSASVLEDYVDDYTVVVPPLYIDTVRVNEADDTVEITTISYEATIRMFKQQGDNEGYLVWSAKGFSTLSQDLERGVRLNIDADPWMDQTFVAGDELYFSDAYGCNCPSFSHGMVTAPQSEWGPLNEERRQANRQARYPLPSAGSYKDPEGLSNNTAGIVVSWKTKKDKLEVPACKHVVASMFDDGLDVLEPRSVPAYTDQIKFAEELKNEPGIDETIDDAAERAEISFIDLLFSVSQLTMLSDTEIGSIIGGQTLIVDQLEET